MSWEPDFPFWLNARNQVLFFGPGERPSACEAGGAEVVVLLIVGELLIEHEGGARADGEEAEAGADGVGAGVELAAALGGGLGEEL